MKVGGVSRLKLCFKLLDSFSVVACHFGWTEIVMNSLIGARLAMQIAKDGLIIEDRFSRPPEKSMGP
jgi:hypothetical protein